MHEFPHHYVVAAAAAPEAEVTLQSDGLPTLASAAPAAFDGPGDRWSPETLLVAAVADCFILSFRAIAKASHLEWSTLECRTTGTLDRVERELRFVRFDVEATLTIPAGGNEVRATSLLDKAKRSCLVTNSLSAESHLTTEIRRS